MKFKVEIYVEVWHGWNIGCLCNPGEAVRNLVQNKVLGHEVARVYGLLCFSILFINYCYNVQLPVMFYLIHNLVLNCI